MGARLLYGCGFLIGPRLAPAKNLHVRVAFLSVSDMIFHPNLHASPQMYVKMSESDLITAGAA